MSREFHQYVIEYRTNSFGDTQWRPFREGEISFAGKNETNQPPFWTFMFLHSCPVYLITGSMVRIIDPWEYQGQTLWAAELCAAWIKHSNGGWSTLYDRAPADHPKFLRENIIL